MDLLKRHLCVKEWILEAGETIRKELHGSLEIEEKTNRKDLVTNIDKKTEQFFIQKIRSHFPNEKIKGEEGFGDVLSDLKGKVWFVDPIDGTLNFIKQQRDFGIMVSLYEDGIGQLAYIYDVMRGDLVFAIKGQGVYKNDKRLLPPKKLTLSDGLLELNGNVMLNATDEIRNLVERSIGTRTIGAASMETLSVVYGHAVAYCSFLLAPWDVASGLVIAKELGLCYTTLSGEPIDLLQPKTTAMIYQESVKDDLIRAFQHRNQVDLTFK